MSARSADRFVASLACGALAALLWPAIAVLLGPLLGAGPALALHLAACALLYALLFGRVRLRALRRRPARALALELGLAASGAALARAVFGPSLAGTSLAIWAFALVQSGWFLAGGGADPAPAGLDPFDEAHRRAQALLEEEPAALPGARNR